MHRNNKRLKKKKGKIICRPCAGERKEQNTQYPAVTPAHTHKQQRISQEENAKQNTKDKILCARIQVVQRLSRCQANADKTCSLEIHIFWLRCCQTFRLAGRWFHALMASSGKKKTNKKKRAGRAKAEPRSGTPGLPLKQTWRIRRCVQSQAEQSSWVAAEQRRGFVFHYASAKYLLCWELLHFNCFLFFLPR